MLTETRTETAALTPGTLIERLGLDAGPAVSGYRDAVVAEATRRGLRVEHTLGHVQIGLELPAVPELTIGWRVGTGWCYLRRPGWGEPPDVGPTRYLRMDDPLEQALPAPSVAADWLCELGAGRDAGSTAGPGPVVAGSQIEALVGRLCRYRKRPVNDRTEGTRRPTTLASDVAAGR